MSGIAGIAMAGRTADVERMLDAMAHRGQAGRYAGECDGTTLGAVASRAKQPAWDITLGLVRDETGPGHFARAQARHGTFLFSRDPAGVSPLYLGSTCDGVPCFASEVKALRVLSASVHELPPGGGFRPEQPLPQAPETLASRLRERLEAAVQRALAGDGVVGSWLSGGLDSSAMAALARPRVRVLHTFAGGLAGSPDLEFARETAAFLDTEHHEVVVREATLLEVLPEVIGALESFDALLVRSSVVNYLVGRAAAAQVDAVFSGEGGDELFAGYSYLRAMPLELLPAELADITGRLHNTALQRVDRCASAHGLTAHVCFLDPDVMELAFRIPADLKIREGVEKWILRRALSGRLPQRVLMRPKAKFWEGSGVQGLLAAHADSTVTDSDFRRDRRLPNGWELSTKEELLYYRHFRERVGEMESLDWMGRTKGAPKATP